MDGCVLFDEFAQVTQEQQRVGFTRFNEQFFLCTSYD